jgi:hypothetical protein
MPRYYLGSTEFHAFIARAAKYGSRALNFNTPPRVNEVDDMKVLRLELGGMVDRVSHMRYRGFWKRTEVDAREYDVGVMWSLIE